MLYPWELEGDMVYRGPENGALGKPSFCPARKRVFFFNENGKKCRICILTSKTRALLLEPHETTKMTKMAGVPRARAWFTKSTVSWTPSIAGGWGVGRLGCRNIEPLSPRNHLKGGPAKIRSWSCVRRNCVFGHVLSVFP